MEKWEADKLRLDHMHKLFEKCAEEHNKFDNVIIKRSARPDLNAFLLLDELQPGQSDIVVAAEHDEIYLKVDPQKLAEIITEEHVLELVRSGVRYDHHEYCFKMYV